MTVQELQQELEKYHPNLNVWLICDEGQFEVQKVEQDCNSILLIGDSL